jgi:hypothetical protein
LPIRFSATLWKSISKSSTRGTRRSLNARAVAVISRRQPWRPMSSSASRSSKARETCTTPNYAGCRRARSLNTLKIQNRTSRRCEHTFREGRSG